MVMYDLAAWRIGLGSFFIAFYGLRKSFLRARDFDLFCGACSLRIARRPQKMGFDGASGTLDFE